MKYLLLTLIFLTTSCSSYKWYKGNTNTHSLITGDGDSSPKNIVQWYHDHDYNFLVISEKNIFLKTNKIKLPDQTRQDFILLPGQELVHPLGIHTTAINTKHLIPGNVPSKTKTGIIQAQIDAVVQNGGIAILNHPNLKYTLTPKDTLPLQKLSFMEVFSNQWYKSNFSEYHLDHPIEEIWWDRLLSKGHKTYGVASDNAYIFQKQQAQALNPGRGWIMVKAKELTSQNIASAMKSGNFYSSTGVHLKDYRIHNNKMIVNVDINKTKSEMAQNILREGKKSPGKSSGFLIELIGHNGKLLKSIRSSRAEFKLIYSSPYYRVKVTYFQNHPKHGHEAFYAWTQPYFRDHRSEQ
ncbi:MAG: CehA/McbA family metallohydrolase [Lentisphaeraceae bacterium]|nr:CehA/McbA family metallohydrolase [Lentisphaeraceae bacterium]